MIRDSEIISTDVLVVGGGGAASQSNRFEFRISSFGFRAALLAKAKPRISDLAQRTRFLASK